MRPLRFAILASMAVIPFFLESGCARKAKEPPLTPALAALAKDCETNRYSSDCCVASVRYMAAHGYSLAPAAGCPSGQSANMLRCVDSFRWCEPDLKKP